MAKTSTAEKNAQKGAGFPGEDGYIEPLHEKMLALVTDPELASPGEIARAIAEKIVAADDFDAALDMGEAVAVGAREMVGEVFSITHPVTWLKSSPAFAENGLGVFVVLNVTMEDGTARTVTCGGMNVLAQIYKGVTVNPPAIPSPERKFKFRSVDTSTGFDTLYLTRG